MLQPSAEAEVILVPESLQETLYRLEEARLGFRPKSTVHIEQALQWVLSRQGLKGSYRGLFAPTEKDSSEGLQLITGERYPRRHALTRHILGEEALRATTLWGLGSSPVVARALEGFQAMLELGERPAKETGFYCCYTCTMPFLRTLSVVKPENWDETLERGIENIKQARTTDGRWRGFPFYYTLLMLSELDTSAAEAELKHAGRICEKLLHRQGNKEDRASQFRRLGLEAALNAL